MRQCQKEIELGGVMTLEALAGVQKEEYVWEGQPHVQEGVPAPVGSFPT